MLHEEKDNYIIRLDMFKIGQITEKRRDMKPIRRMSLVWKMTIITTMLLLIPVIVLGVFYLQTYRVTLLRGAESKMETSISQMENNIDGGLREVTDVFSELFYRQEFSYILDGKNQLSDGEMGYYFSTLSKELYNSKQLYDNKYGEIGIYSSNSQIVERYHGQRQFYLSELMSKRFYREIETSDDDQLIFGNVRQTEISTSGLETSKLNLAEGEMLVLPVYRKVYSLNTNEMVGVVEIDISIPKLAGKSTLGNEEGDAASILLDQKKGLLFDTKRYSENLEKAMIDAVQGEKGSSECSYQGQSFFVTYKTCEKTGLILMSVVPKAPVNAALFYKGLLILGLTVVCLFLLAGLTYYIMNNVLKRMVVLDHMMSQVGNGDFKVQMPVEDSTDDELTRITRTFNWMASQLDQVLEERVQNEKTKKDAELRALQAQINPHFLYNTLENMRMQCEIGEFDFMGDSLSALGDLFRYSISWGSNEAPFSKEWKNMNDYLYIMQMRFGDELECTVECGEGLSELTVPKMMLQPLVENSFNHGFKDKLPPWKLWINARLKEDMVEIVIMDNGSGIEQGRMERLQKSLRTNQPFRNEEKKRYSIGVTNVKQRIEMLCKEGSTLKIENMDQEGTRITINIIL